MHRRAARSALTVHEEQSNNFLLDGVDNNDLAINQIVVPPAIDTVEEFKVQTSTYAAEYGRSGGGQFNFVTKSGTNDWRFSGYEFLRNAALDARNAFDDPARDMPQFQRDQFGATVGGPLKRQRWFAFGNYEGQRVRKAFTRIARDGAAERLAGRRFLQSADRYHRCPNGSGSRPALRPANRVSHSRQQACAAGHEPGRSCAGQVLSCTGQSAGTGTSFRNGGASRTCGQQSDYDESRSRQPHAGSGSHVTVFRTKPASTRLILSSIRPTSRASARTIAIAVRFSRPA